MAIRLGIAASLGALPLPPTALPAHAEDNTAAAPAAESLLKPGDIAASGFAGVKLQGEGLRPGVDPLTKTVIDPAGITLRIYDGSRATEPLAGQQLDLPPRKEFKAEEIGHVFGLVFDQLPADERGTPGLYAAATSAFGLYIVGPDTDGDGQPDRLMKGAPGARFMDGLFGKAPGGGAGAIWKIDSITGAASLYAELGEGGLANSGPGIGGLALDPMSRSLYASDLDTGVIHQLKGASVGEDVGQFDHGMQGEPQAGRESVADDGHRLDVTSPDFDTTDPATWGFTQSARRIDAMAVHGRRLYYAVAKGPEIWSVGLADDGSFLQDARIEVGVDEQGTIATITFDSQGGMILAIRGAVQNAGDYSAFVANGPTDVIRYAPQKQDDQQAASAWELDTLTYPVGQSQERRDGSGGLALQYAYREDGSLDLASCGGTLVVSGDVLDPRKTVHGLQIGEAGRFQKKPGSDVPTAFVALDPAQDDAAARGHAGGVAVLSRCEGPGGFPPVASDGTQFPGVAGGGGGGQPGFPGVDTGGGGGTGFPGVDNGGGGGGKPTFPPIEGGDQTGKLTLVKTAAVPKCSPDGGCAFNIEVVNKGPEVPGPITINEQIEAPGAVLTGEPDAPWKCSKAAPFTCTHPGPVPANDKLDMRLVFAPHTAPEVKELKNCASLAGAAAKPAGKQKAQAVAPVALPPPTASNAGGLVVQASGVPAQCSPKTGNCEFEVTVTNSSPNPVTGPFRVIQTLAVGTQSQAKNEPRNMSLPAGLQCKPDGRELDCQQPELTLAPGDSRTIRVAFSIDTTEGGAADFVQSKAVVTLGPLAGEATAAIAFDEPLNNKLPEPDAPQADQNQPGAPQAGQDQPQAPACATIPLDPKAPVQAGPVVFSKKGPASCPLVGPCTFEITLTNITDATVPGPIPFTDTPDVAGAKLSDAPIPAPFACAKGGPPFNCTFGNAALGLGPHESKTLTLTLDLDLPNGTNSLNNCAVKPAAPAAPQKKALLLLRPSKRNPLISYASFRPEFSADRKGLLHLIDDAGGNIGGVNGVAKDCTKWGVKNGGFVIRQSNGLEIHFGQMVVDANGAVTGGQVSYFPKGGGAAISGTVTGTLSGNKFILDVKWKVASGDTGHYEGAIGADGKVTGNHVNKAGVHDTFVNQGDWWICKSSQFCDGYADGVGKAALALALTGCAPKDTQGLWAPMQNQIDFCMSRASTADPEIEAKNKARADEIAQCAADIKAKEDSQCTGFAQQVISTNAAIKALNCGNPFPWATREEAKAVCLGNSPSDRRAQAQNVKKAFDACVVPGCDRLGKDALALNDQLKALNCDEAIPELTPVDASRLCLDMPQHPDSFNKNLQRRLDRCKAKLAGNPDPGAGGGAGGGQAVDQPEKPAPEQCAMVAIKDIVPPGGGGKVTPKPEQPQASIAGPLSLVKTFSNEACVNNRCKFNIAITNTSDAAFQGRIDFTDEETDGVFNRGTVSTESNPKFFCQEQNGRFLCSNSAVALAAKSAISITLTVDLGEGATPAKEIRNCAKLDGAPTPSCATAPLQAPAPPNPQPQASTAGPLSLVKTFSKEACVDNRCKFNITLTNTSDAEVKGQFGFSDDLRGDGGLFDSATVSATSDPKFDCAKQGQGFVCSSPLIALAAKSSVNITLVADLGKGIGAVKEMENCAKLDGAQTSSCATAPLQAPAQPKNLALANNPGVAQCSDIGGGCTFIASLSNPADASSFDGPVSFTAHLSQQDGSAFPNITMEGGGEASSNDPLGVSGTITCKKDGNDVTCTSVKSMKFLPGKSIQVPMTFKPGGGTMATAIKSCASVADGEKQCVSIPLVKGPLLQAQKLTASTSCVPSCTFAISLKNVGNDNAPGPFVIDEDFKPLNGDTDIDVIDGDFQCFRSAKPSLACISSKDKLEPGQSLNGRVTIKTGTVSPSYTNCIDYNPAANGKPSPFDREARGRCVTIKDTVHQGVNMMVEVFAPNADKNGIGECAINSPCRFRIKLTSNGTETDTHVLFGAHLDHGVAEAMGEGPGMAVDGWNCSPTFATTKRGTCAIMPVGKVLSPQTFVDAEFGVIAGATWKKNDTLTLCADLEDDSNLNDNHFCASVKLDPFNVKVAKTGDQSCALGGDCNFTIRLFNPGPIDHNAPVTISDKLTGLASVQIVSITPPLPCAAQPTQIPFSCTSPGPVRLDLDAPEGSPFGPREFKMVVRLPGDASSKQFSNCADASDGSGAQGVQSCVTVAALPPVSTCQAGMVITNGICACPAGTKWNGRTCGGEGSGGASASKPIAPEPAPVVTAPAAACGFGMVLASNGLCACPPNTSWTGKACVAGPGSGGFNTSMQPAPEPAPVPTTPPATCKFGMVLASNGLCACPPNTSWTGKACAAGPGSGGFNTSMQPAPEQIKACPAARPVGTYPNCCPQGTEYRNGKCRYTQAVPAEVKCSNGLVKDARTGKCVACPRGTHTEGKACVPDRKQQKQARVCPADRPVGAYPNCCPQGTEYRNGKCRLARPDRERACPANRPIGTYPNCCPEGTQFRDGACRRLREQPDEQSCPSNRPNGTYPNCCPEGTQFRDGACRRVRQQPPEEQSCPSNRPNGTYPNCCPNGYEFNGHRCRKPFDQQPGGGGTSNPTPTQQHDCPPGYRVLSKPNKYGAYCEQIPVDQPAPPPPQPAPPPPAQCTGGKVPGSNGGCVCPGGMREGADGQCFDRVG